MQENFSKLISTKYSPSPEIYNARDSSSRKDKASPKKVGSFTSRQDRKYIFNLNSFQKNDQRKKSSDILSTSQASNSEDTTQKIQTTDSQKQSQRNIIYGSQSYKQKCEQEIALLTTARSNNDIFSMVFLNKTTVNTQHKDTPSFSKQTKPKIEQPEINIKIEDFDIGKKLGAGKFGNVFLAKHRSTGFLCALKRIQKNKIDSKLIVQLVREIKIQMFLNHPNVVKMFGFFSDTECIYLAMELCYSGQLYGYLKRKRRVAEDQTRAIVQQICKALDYMHQNEIIHRDLKPENIIYQSGLLKICDFGWSISTSTMRATFCGTPLYVSPELLKRKSYNNKIDVWSVGILTYQLLFGRVPFEIQTQQDFIKIVEDQIKFSKVTQVSDDAKHFILNCLQKDPTDRCSISQLLQHPFLLKLQNVSILDMY